MSERAYSIIERPIMTEKSVRAKDQNKYVFKVHLKANKLQIKEAVEQIFNVKVKKVNTMMVKGKPRRFGRHPEGRTARWKKAVVTLAEGYKIAELEGI